VPEFRSAVSISAVGLAKALLLDTGAQAPPGETLPLRAMVRSLAGRMDLELVAGHSHSHGDHVAGDPQFVGQPNTVVVSPALDSVRSFFGLPDWPEGSARFDLGGRVLTIFPIPGHEQTHIAIYDARTRLLLSGDTLYPGLLTVEDWPAYFKSAARLSRSPHRTQSRSCWART
jgi:hydroxyacylglutathione hydrolase